MKYLPILLLFLILSGCASTKATRKLKKGLKTATPEEVSTFIAKGVEKYPQLILTDTVLVKDTIITETALLDTFFSGVDTLIIDNEDMRLEYVYLRDTAFIRVECKGDTVYYEKKVPFETITVQDTDLQTCIKKVRSEGGLVITGRFLKFGFWSIIILIICGLVGYFVRKLR